MWPPSFLRRLRERNFETSCSVTRWETFFTFMKQELVGTLFRGLSETVL